VEGIAKRFGGVQALRGVRLDVLPGELHFLLGENGAGKSTLGKIVAGVHRPDAGTMRFAGEPFAPANPTEAQQRGVAIIFQELDLFPHLTVAENIAARNSHFAEGWFASRARLAAFCGPFLERVGLDVSPHRLVGDLSMGQMQLVAIARALSMKARLIVMDEPTSSLAHDAVENLFGIVDSLKRDGVAMIYVSHKMSELVRIADRVTVMRDGAYIDTLKVSETTVERLIALMVGREIAAGKRARSHRTDRVVLGVDGLRTARLRDVSLKLHAGEVLGIAGLVGSGRTEIGLALAGLDKLHGGTIHLCGERYGPRNPRRALECGLGMMPEDRKLGGLMMQMAVRENATMASMGKVSRCNWISRAKESAAFDAVAKATMLKAPSPRHAVSTLSGGNQQKVLLGRWLMADPEVYFLDDPTRGVDVGAKEDIYAIVERLAAQGKGVLMVSSELPELLRCCDRILVMNDGRVAGCLDIADATQEAIMTLAASATEAA